MLNKKNIYNLIISYLITFMLFNLGGFASTDILLGLVFVGVYFILEGIRPVRTFCRPACIMACIQTLLYWIYAKDRLGGGMENRLFAGAYTLLSLAGIFALIYIVTAMILQFISGALDRERRIEIEDIDQSLENRIHSSFPFRLFFLYALIIFICLLPLFIINLPGTMTVDSFDQLGQAMGIYPYSDHHPWGHTLLIKLFYTIGYKITGTVNGGIGTYTLIQMLILSLSVAYAITCMDEAGLPKWGQILMLLAYVLYPYNLAYAITMWKDIIFSAATLVLTVTLFRICCLRGKGLHAGLITARDIVLWMISGLIMCLMRHNGLYAYILSGITLIVILAVEYRISRKEGEDSKPAKKQLQVFSCMTFVTLCIVLLFNGPIQKIYNVEQVDYAHNLPIPLQQIARVISHNGDIDPDDMAMLERINTTDYLKNNYHPGGADPTMQWLVFGDSEYFESHKAEYLGLWIRIGLKNPVAYLEAYVDITRGYYTTMPPEQTEYYGILPNEQGLYNTPIMNGNLRAKINEFLSKIGQTFPVYGILYSPGACMQLLIFGVIILITMSKSGSDDDNKKGDSLMRLITFLPVCAIMITILIAVPLCADLRYAYSLMLCMPSLIAITLSK